MEATAVSVGKSALDGALSYAKSAIAEEVTLQLGIQRDQAFIRDELQMMQSFLMAADKQHGDHGVLKTWVKQVRDVAYDVEDCLQDYVVRLEKTSWWRLPGTKLREGHRIAKEMKELRAKVEDVSQRNMRYNLISGSASGSASKPPSATAPGEQSDAIFKIEARRAAKQEKVDLAQLITKEGDDLRVMAVCGSVDVRMASIVRAAYQKVKGKFECPAWVRLTRPFNPKEFIWSLVRQFQESTCDEAGKMPEGTPVGMWVLERMEQQDYKLTDDFKGYVVNKRFLIVLSGLSTIEEWDWIKTYLPDNHHGSRIVLCTEHAEVAGCCIEDGPKMSEIQQEGPFVNPLYVFYKEDSPPEQGDKPESSLMDSSALDGRAMQALFKEDQGQIKGKDANSEIVELISKGGKVVSVWGMGAVGETGLVRSVYKNDLAGNMFQKRAWVSVKRPFMLDDFFKMLVQQLHQDDGRQDGENMSKLQDDSQSSKRKKGTAESTRKLLIEVLSQNKCLLVIDDVSILEWDSIMKNVLSSDENAANRIIVTTKEFSVAIHCSGEKQYTYKLEALPSADDTLGRLKKMDSLADEHAKPDSGPSASAGNSSMVPSGENQDESTDPKTEEAEKVLQSLSEENNRQAPVKREDAKSDVVELISKDGMVISVWGMAGVGKTALVREVYDDGLHDRFEKRAWFSMERPFSEEKFAQDMVTQLHQGDESQDEEDNSDHGVEFKFCCIFKRRRTPNSRRRKQSTDQSTRQSLAEILSQNRCLVVIDDVSSSEEWDLVMKYILLDANTANRIIVITKESSVAIHCSGEGQYTYNLEAPNDDDAYDHFKNEVDSPLASPDSSKGDAYVSTSKAVHFDHIVLEDDSEGNSGSSSPLVMNKDPGPMTAKKLTRSMTLAAADQAQLIDRKEEKDKVIELVAQDRLDRQVVSVWGMGGIGKTTLVKSIYQSPELEKLKFERRAWVTVLRPFRLTELLRSLAQRLLEDSPGKKQGESVALGGGTKNELSMMGTKDLIDKLRKELDGKKYLIVLDDLSSTAEWDSIVKYLPANNNGSRIIVTTRPKGIAQHCSQKEVNVHSIEGLTDDDAFKLFINKVYKERDEPELKHDLQEEAKVIVKKCGRLPLAISTVGGYLSTRPRNIKEWRKFIDHISVELENNPELDMIKTALNSSYDGLPYHLKSCFLYLSIFPEDHNIRCRRLVRRWIAEGYSREVRSKTAEEVAQEHFMHIINRSMIQPSRKETHKIGNTTDFCQVHDLMREISISKSEEENLVFVLDEHSTTRRSKDKVRHLVVSKSWSREKKKNALENIMDVSHIRSLTVFGEWRSYFFSKKMRMLRVLDLEDTEGLQDRDLVPIGELHHLKYLSLRGCETIFHLPNSFGNLLNLETLDIRGTFVTKLPGTVGKIEKLKYLRAGKQTDDEEDIWSELPVIPLVILAMCSEYYSGEILEEATVRQFMSVLVWVIRGYWRHLDVHGVIVPKGIGRLRSIHTLGIVNIAQGKDFLKNLKKLTQLRKLGVTGITKNNCKELCSAIVNHGLLRSLCLRAEGETGIKGCLDGLSPPPEYLESLKLYGNLVKLPKWIGQLDNLQKLSLRSTNLEMMQATMEVLGKLPMLGILRLQDKAFEATKLHFRSEGFPNLMVLELVSWTRLDHVKFEDGATAPKLEVIRVDHCRDIDDDGFHGIESLPSLKEVSLEGYYNTKFMNDLQEQLDKNENKPNLKIV